MRIAGDAGMIGGWRFYRCDLERALQEVLAALADLDCRFDCALEGLDRTPLPEDDRKRVARELGERHRCARAPFLGRLAEIEADLIASPLRGAPQPA